MIKYLDDAENQIKIWAVELEKFVQRESLPEEKWTNKEVLGHLIDSAANNHQRFIRGQFSENMVFLGYDQNNWVKASDYNNYNWQDLINLWKNYNLLLVHIIKNINEEDLVKTNKKTNINEIVFKEVISKEELTLQYLIEDYFRHLYHHLEQIKNQSKIR